MPTTFPPAASALTLAIAVFVLVVPGLLVGLTAGLRGWLLAGAAPLLTFAVAGVSGQWLGAVGIGFGWVTFAVATAVFAGLGFALRRLRGEPSSRPPLWSPSGHLAVGACWLAAAFIGGYTMLRGMGDLGAIPQGWDAVFHANGIRYVTDTGDSSVTGMSKVAWYAPGEQIFYPNAYHLVSSLIWQITGPTAGAPIPAVLNAVTVLMPAMLGLSLITLIREFAGRAVLAGFTPIVTVVTTMVLYDLQFGPITPYAQALVLLPVGFALVHRYLNQPLPGIGCTLGLAVAGLMAVHASMVFTGALFLLPYLLGRWRGGLGVLGRDLKVLLAPAAGALLFIAPTVIGALVLVTGDYPYRGWPWKQPVGEAARSWLLFGGQTVTPQIWLAAAFVIGVVTFWRLRELRWLLGTAFLVGIAFVVTSTVDSEVVKQLTRPWWNNPYRLVNLAALAMCVIAAHGLAEIHALLKRLAGNRTAVSTGLAVLVIGGWSLGSELYVDTNSALVQTTVGRHSGQDPHALPVSRDEAQAMVQLGELARPGDWVLNERSDGTAWSYALGGVRAVAGHYDPFMNPPDADVLAGRFRDYATDPQVRDLVARMNVRWVITGQSGYPRYPDGSDRAPGLRDLDGLPFLEVVYRNADSTLYRIIG